MRRLLHTAALACTAVLLSAGTAQAKDLCVQDNFGDYWKFIGIKSVTQQGKATALTGIYSVGGFEAPVSGTAFRTPTGVAIGVFVHSMAPFSTLNFTVTMVTDTAFNGGGGYDNDGDYVQDSAINWTNVSCSSLPPLGPLAPKQVGPSIPPVE